MPVWLSEQAGTLKLTEVILMRMFLGQLFRQIWNPSPLLGYIERLSKRLCGRASRCETTFLKW
jgi:hypothetical protein